MSKNHLTLKLASHLKSICFEMSALAYLLQQKRKDDIPPLAIEEINYGTGQILNRITWRIKRLVNKLEETVECDPKNSKT